MYVISSGDIWDSGALSCLHGCGTESVQGCFKQLNYLSFVFSVFPALLGSGFSEPL